MPSGLPAKAAKGFRFKGSAWAKRATKRGGNPARTQNPRLVHHQLDPRSRFCRRCSYGMAQIVNHRLIFCEGR